MKSLLACILIVLSPAALAISDFGRTVSHLGVQGPSGYFSVQEGFSANCQYGNVYLDITTDFGKTAYSTILAAKTSGETNLKSRLLARD